MKSDHSVNPDSGNFIIENFYHQSIFSINIQFHPPSDDSVLIHFH